MSIGEYCERPAATIAGGATLREAAQRMRDEGLGSLVVVDAGRALGIVTDRDLALGTLCDGLDAGAVAVTELVGRPLVAIGEDRPVREAVRRMRGHGLRRLPVVDAAGCPVGIVTVDDLVSLVAAELSGLAVAVRAQAPERTRGGGG